jgi:hypothetical protein
MLSMGGVSSRNPLAIALGISAILVGGCAPATPSVGTATGAPPPGAIWFGPTITGLTMPSHATTFPANTAFGWLAEFTMPAGTTSIGLDLDSVATTGISTPLVTAPGVLSNPAATAIAHAPDLSLAIEGPGTYRLRIVANGTLIAAGSFTITP